MKPLNISLHRIYIFLFGLFLICRGTYGQSADLGIQFTFDGNASNTVLVGSYFSITGNIYHDTNSSDVPAGESVVATVELLDPSGLVIDSHTQTWNGFPTTGVSGALDNDNSVVAQVLFFMPWIEASKWAPGNKSWQLVARVTGAALESDLSDNIFRHTFELEIPNLQVTSVAPIGANFRPNSDLIIDTTVINNSNVQTQNGVFFPLEARLLRGTFNSSLAPQAGDIVDSERIILPFTDGGITPTIRANNSLSTNLPPLRIPQDADGNFTVQVIVDPTDIQPLGSVVYESNENDNHMFYNFTVTNGLPNLQINPNSFTGEVGTFRGLDPVRLGFAIRNESNFAIEPQDAYTARVALSLNNTFDSEDYILREFDLSGDALGANLLPNETIHLDWVQQMPDNWEGDYYLMVNIQETGQTFLLQNTPSISLLSRHYANTKVVSYEEDNATAELYNRLDEIDEELQNLEDLAIEYFQTSIANLLDAVVNNDRNPQIVQPITSQALALRDEKATIIVELSGALMQDPKERPSTSRDGSWVAYTQLDENRIKQVYLAKAGTRPREENEDILVSSSFFDRNIGGNSHSLAPKISADGTTLVFHSSASDLVPADENGVEDIFVYSIISEKIIKYANSSGIEASGGSFYPNLNQDGSVVVFESFADNLVGNFSPNGFRQIYLWDRTSSETYSITNGNGDSHTPTISGNGKRVVFASDANNLLATTGLDQNSLRDVFLYDRDSNQTSILSVNQMGLSTNGGTSDQPQISGNGDYVVFRSEATNILRQGGITKVEVERGGVGYFGNIKIEIRDSAGFGRGALLEIKNDGVDAYGQIMKEGIEIVLPGENYESPEITIIPDPSFPAPSQTAIVKAYLVNPGGEIYRVETMNPAFSLQRISTSPLGGGGDMPSREPSISEDGKVVVYSTKSSNLLDINVTREDKKIFYNRPVRQARAQALIVGGIGEIEVLNGGSGYQNGFLVIDDYSGLGSGATANYEVDAFGRISSINLINSGQNYNLETTVIGVENPRGGSGFVAGEIRFSPADGIGQSRSGGGKIHQIQILDHGMGYYNQEENSLLFGEIISLEGDGVDANQDGLPDAKINPEKIHIDPQTGGIFIEQTFSIRLLTTESLVGATLTISDANKTLDLRFTRNFDANIPDSIAINNHPNISSVRDEILTRISNTWNSPQSIFQGPQIENNATGGDSFLLNALSGRVIISNPSSIEVIAQSNMLFSGDGFTRATPVITFPPVIYGFSEVNSIQQNVILENDRMGLVGLSDDDTDDIYLFTEDASSGHYKNERVSLSKFGQPVNYLPTALSVIPSNRFPVLSGNGRHIYFTSDAGERAGLVFDHSNQTPTDFNNGRDLFHFDRLINEPPESSISVTLLFPNSDSQYTFAGNAEMPIIVDIDYDGMDLGGVDLYINSERVQSLQEFLPDLATNRFFGIFNTPDKGELTVQAVAVNRNRNQLGSSEKAFVSIKQSDGTLAPRISFHEPMYYTATDSSRLPVSVVGSDPDGYITGVQYYINGHPFGGEILNSTENFNALPNFSSILEFNQTGVNSIFAIGRDNSENYVSSEIFNIPITKGAQAPQIEMTGGIKSVDLESPQIEVITVAGAIEKINLLDPLAVGSNFVTPPKVQVFGSGYGAKIIAEIDDNITSVNYGKVVNFLIDPLNPGTGYDDKTKLRLVPTVRAIGFGTPAEVRLAFVDDGNGTTIPSRVNIRRNADQSPITGSGYVNSPRLVVPPYASITGFERLPLTQVQGGSYGVDPSTFPINVTTRDITDAFLVGGFTQSVLNFEFLISEPEKIQSVVLIVDGREEARKSEPPFAFQWIPDEVKEYQVYAAAQDFSGNVIVTGLNYISVGQFSGGGVEASFDMAQNITLPTNASLFLNGSASSEHGIAEVEFYMEGVSLGKVKAEDDQKKFFKEVKLQGFSQGTFEISMIARDKAGNEASSFSPFTTNILSRQNLRLTVVASSQDSASNSLKLLYPNLSESVKFSTQSSIPVIVDFNESVLSGGVNFAMVLLDGNPLDGVMSQHEVADSANPQFNDYITNRYTYSIDPRNTSVGKHILQAVLYSAETEMPIAQTNFIEIEITDYAQLSPIATLQDIPDDFKNITNTSSVVFSVNAEDLDASIESVQYYVNGQAHGPSIPRVSLVSEDKSKYLLYFEPRTKGSHSIHAVATDTSGNNVATLIESILVTDGTLPSTVEFDENFVNQEIPFSDLNVQLDPEGGILKLEGLSINQKYTAEPEVRVRGIGSGSVLHSSLDVDGTIKEIIIETPGRGYQIENSSIILIPSRRVVREGTPAEVITTWMDYSPGGPPSEVSESIATMIIRQQELQLQNNQNRLNNDPNATGFGFGFFNFNGLPLSYFTTEDWETTYSLKRSFDDSISTGEGYVVSPRFDPPIVIEEGNQRKLVDRLTLTEPVNGTSSVEDFTYVKPGAFAKANLSGGFTRAPLYIQALPKNGYDNIESVSLMVNGIINDEDRLTKKPYNFIWVPGDPEDYILSFVVKDYDGNIYTTPAETLSVKDYYGSGIGSKFHGSIESEIQIGSEAIYSVQASSEFGVSEVEFYLDGESVGMGTPVGSGVYNIVVNFDNLTQGEHYLSYVARDFKGNESGTFDSDTTNLIEFKNKRVIVVSSSEQDPPTSYVYPKSALAGEISYRFWRGQQEVIIMIEADADPDGYIEEIFLYSDGEMLQTSDGNFSIRPSLGTSNVSQNLYAFKFTPQKLGLFELKAMVKDNFGTQRFSENEILIEVLANSAQAPEINFISPMTETVITTSSTIRLEVNATDPDGTMESVQFYVNGLKHGTEILFDKSYIEYNYPYGINWSPPETGTYTIHAVAKDNDNNEVLSDYVVVNVASGNDLIPQIDFEDLNQQYLPNQTIFLSAQITDSSLGSNQRKGIIEEVIFYSNGHVVDRITEQPYFTRWTPSEIGLYEVYLTAKDNEGNIAISNVQNVRVIDETLINETPIIGSLNPTVTGTVIKITTETFRRAGTNVAQQTIISGLSTKFLNQLGNGQKIRFSDGQNTTKNTYEIDTITSDEELVLKTVLLPEDETLISNWSSLEIVPLYRAGSWISLNLKSDVEDSNFQYVDFYVDGTMMSRDDTWPFSGLFIPPQEGNYTLGVISVNAKGGQNLFTERIEVLPKKGLLPDGSTSIHPQLTRSGSTTIGSELIVTANYDDLDDGMNRVEFYLNGSLIYVDREKPFYFKFKPETDGSILSTDRGWEVTAVGIDNSGNRISLTQAGNVQSAVILPVAEIKSPNENEVFADGQAIKVRIDVKGSNMENLLGTTSMASPNPNLSLTPRMMNVMANGVVIGIAVESSWGSGIFMSDWICDLDFAGPTGEVEIVASIVMTDEIIDGLPFTPTILSDIVTIKIVEPNVAGDTKAAVNQVFNDLLGQNPTEQEVNLAVSEEIGETNSYLFENDDFLRWAAHLTEREVFQNMVDAIAGFKIMIGRFPDYLKITEIMDTYSAVPNYGQDGSADLDGDGFSLRQENLFLTSDQDASDFPSSAFSMGSFVDDTLSSSDYTDVYGEVPVLTPPAGGGDRFTNYEKNRRDFVRNIYQNKYGVNPTIQQETQGSYRISVFDPNSKEAQEDQRLMMMQQMSMYTNFGYGGGGQGRGQGGGNINPFASLLGNTNLQNNQQSSPTFRNGEPAVLFVVNMIAEETISNMSMIWGAQNMRSYYKTGALIASFWQDNMGVLSDELISQFHGKGTETIISELMKDRRYFSRFGGLSISKHATEVESAPGWKWLHWLGHFNDERFPWIYHAGLGWIYVHGPTDDQTWFYFQNAGWLGTTKQIWSEMNESSNYLWLYENKNARWVAYFLQEPDGKLFWDSQNNKFFTYD